MTRLSTIAAALACTLWIGRTAAADQAVLDIQGPVAGGAVTVSIHDDFLGLEFCGSTCFAPSNCSATVVCAPGATPSAVANALAGAISLNASCLGAGVSAVSDPVVAGRLILSWPNHQERNVCVDGWLFRDRDQCCGLTLATACGTFTCTESATAAYCTAGTSSAGCLVGLSATGVASASATAGFQVLASRVEGGKAGLFFFGTNGRQASPWGNGASYQCVAPPVQRATLLPGGGQPGFCNGLSSEDLNALWCASCPKPGHNPGVGALVQAQFWYRDPLNTSNQTTSLSNALEFNLEP